MNIFYLDHDSSLAATLMYDGHLGKLSIEGCQMASAIINIIYPEYSNEALMKPTHVNHPCTIWARQSSLNFKWLVDHTEALFAEYTKRYSRVHACQVRFEALHDAFIECMRRLAKQGLVDLTKPALAMPDDFKRDCPVKSYELYYEYKQQMETFKVSMHSLAVALDMKEYATGKKVRKIALRMVRNK